MSTGKTDEGDELATAKAVETGSPPDYSLAIGLFIDFIAQAVTYFRS